MVSSKEQCEKISSQHAHVLFLPTLVFLSPHIPHSMGGLDQPQHGCPHLGEHSLGHQAHVAFGESPINQEVPVPKYQR